MRKFDYDFLNNGLLPAKLVNLTSSISSLKTMASVRKEEYTQIFTELEVVAKVQSIKSSNAIEGIVTSDERIAAIVNQNSAPLNHNEFHRTQQSHDIFDTARRFLRASHGPISCPPDYEGYRES